MNFSNVAGTMHGVPIQGDVLINFQGEFYVLFNVAGTMPSVLIRGGVLIAGVV